MIASFTHRRTIPFIVSMAMFMEGLDSTILNTAIPVMAKDLAVNPLNLKIALISYLLSLAIFIPISGWIADRYQLKRVFMCALVVFITSSFFCGYASTLYELVIARMFQGLGGSLMLPLGRLIIVRLYEKHELLNIMNQVVIVGALGIMLGPVLGGVITHHVSWRWIFYVNIPVGLFNILITYYYLPTIKARAVPPLDKIGFLLFGVALALLTFGLSALSETDISRSTTFNILLCSMVLFALYFIHSRNKKNPIINTQIFKLRTFRVSALGNLFSRISFGGMPFVVPLLLQITLGFSPQTSGFLLAPLAVGVVVVKPLSLRFLRAIGYKKLLILNTLFTGMALGAFCLINKNSSYFFIAFLTFIFGFMSALQYTAMNSIAYAEIDQENFSAATSILSTLQQIAQSFGVAISALLIEFFAVNQSFISIESLDRTFMALGVLTLLSVFIFYQLKKNDGHELVVEQKKLAQEHVIES